MLIFDPKQYFEYCHLRESRVLRFAYNQSRGEVRLDVDYAAEVVSHWFEAKLAGVDLDEYQSPPSDFRRFSFSGSSWIDVDHKPFLYHGLRSDGWTNVLNTEEMRFPIIAAFDLDVTLNGFTVKIALQQIGDFHFKFAFASLAVQKTLGRSVLVEGKRSVLEDVDTHRTFDYRNPFPDDLAS